jgi:hypothetical protein
MHLGVRASEFVVISLADDRLVTGDDGTHGGVG